MRPSTSLLSVLLALLLALGLPARSWAQSFPVGSPQERYLRVLQVAGGADAGSFTLRPLQSSALARDSVADLWGVLGDLDSRMELGKGVWAADIGAEIQSFYNSAFPFVQNDGAVWQGKGASVAADLGGTLGFGPVTITLRPTLIYSQNKDYPLALPDREGEEIYRYPWHPAIDLPQRFGPDAVSFLDPGQSSIRVGFSSLSVGVGTENLWWGPGLRNALIMTNNAAGILHGDLRTEKPIDIGPVRFEGQWIWGRPSHSEWYAEAETSPDRFMTGAIFSITPKAVPGLTLGMARIFQLLIPDEGLPVGEWFLVIQRFEKEDFDTPGNPGGDDRRDQMASFFGRWVFPESGFEVYGEWGRNDHSTNLRDYFLEPEHSSAYILGLQKVSPLGGGRLLSVTAEIAHLERSPTRAVRSTPTWYPHYLVPQGYTQRGQIIGASVGPGGNAQYLGVDLYHEGGRLGAFLQRRIHNNDTFYDQTAYGGSIFPHHTSLDLGGSWLQSMRDGFGGEVGIVLTRDFNRYYIDRNDLWNVHIEAALRWRME